MLTLTSIVINCQVPEADTMSTFNVLEEKDKLAQSLCTHQVTLDTSNTIPLDHRCTILYVIIKPTRLDELLRSFKALQ